MPDVYRYNSATGLFDQQGVSSSYSVPLEMLTDSRFRVTGNQVRDTASVGSPVVAGINTVRPTLLTVDEGGNVWLTNQTDRYQINKPARQMTRWSGEISSVTLPDGSVIIPEDTAFSVTAYNTLLFVRTSDGPGGREFRQVGYDPRTGNLLDFFPSDYRLATPAEALEYGAAGWLADRGKDIIAKAIAQGLTDDAGAPITKFTEAAIYLAASVAKTAGRTVKLA